MPPKAHLLGQFEPWGSARALPRNFTDEINDVRIPWDIEIEVEVVDGRPTCKKLVLTQRGGGPPVTSEELRKLRLSHYLAKASARRALQVSQLPDGSISLEPVSGMVQVRRMDVEPPRGRPSKSAGHRSDVLRIFEDAGGGGEGRKAVQDHFEVSYSTAYRWVKNALEHPTEPGRLDGVPGE